jgi:dynein heavy chain
VPLRHCAFARSDPNNIQEHMLKLFDNVKSLQFGRGARSVIGQTSSEGEKYQFVTASPIDGPVEVWMTAAEDEMHKSLWELQKRATFHYAKKPRLQWLREEIGMCVIAGSQIWWTWEVEDVFNRVRQGDKRAMKTLELKLTAQLVDCVVMVREKLDNQSRKKVNTLLIVDLHARDIIRLVN